MLRPTENPPPSFAPRFAASITPGPPPVITDQPASANSRPVVLFDSDFWGELLHFIHAELLPKKMVSPEDIELLHVTDDPAEAVRIVHESYERRRAGFSSRVEAG